MQNHKQFGRLYSASDLVAYLGCHYRTELDLKKLNGWKEIQIAADESTKLIQKYGDDHELGYLDELTKQGKNIVEIDKEASIDVQIETTKAAMKNGADIIFQATLLQKPFIGYADFLLKVKGKSALGEYHYEIIDTKLARSNRGKFIMQLCLYAEMLTTEQDLMPENLHVVLGKLDTNEARLKGLEGGFDNISILKTRDFIDYFRAVRQKFLNFVETLEKKSENENYVAEPVKACGLCGWSNFCEKQREAADHLSRVANINKSQISKLVDNGIKTVTQLSQLQKPIAGIGEPVRLRLQKQAELQINPLLDGELRIEQLDHQQNKISGLELLPKPNKGDLYFDMEGFPYETGGLEYLFGLGWINNNASKKFEFKGFWAHDRNAEKKAFEEFMDFVKDHLEKHPDAHIYHYASYEKTAIKHLSSIHETRTEFRDQLLREGRLIDLYRVVASGLLLALPSYSIKQVEKYYRAQREGQVVDAGASIIMYENFRTTSDPELKASLLKAIEDYNYDDVESTWKLHQWLEKLRPPSMQYYSRPNELEQDENKLLKKEQAASAQQQAIKQLEQWVFAKSAEEKQSAEKIAELLRQIMGFYWRCKLPSLWRKFQLREVEETELLDNLDCLAMLESTGHTESEKRSIRYFFRVPDQESKIETGSSVSCITDQEPAGNFIYDVENGIASFTRGLNREAPPSILSLALEDSISSKTKEEAIYRFIDSLVEDENNNNALLDILKINLPKFHKRELGLPVVDIFTTKALIQSILDMNNSYLVIQGPPGTGKSTNASKAIAELIKAGKKVAVTSNSHAAINHLLNASYREISKQGLSINIAVVKEDPNLPDSIQVKDSNEISSLNIQLVGGTSWLFCREEQIGAWDYLFVDEASQVSLSDLIACGSCAKNIVLLGDQMQLPQPIEGIHPGKSGLSALDYLMDGRATVPEEMGIFLAHSYRMHSEICQPLSEGIYEGRLSSAQSCDLQKLILHADSDPAIKPQGISYVKVSHSNRSQSSQEESERIYKIYQSLLRQQWVDTKGKINQISKEDIIIVAPYNAQIKELKKTLGEKARIGTVDKFQGQEAAVAIYSMTSSDRENIPRGLDFLFSKNRLNVGISRAKCLAIIVASPELELIECEKIEDMNRLNFYLKMIGI